MGDVELPRGEEAPQLASAARQHGVQRLRAVAEERHGQAHANQLDLVVGKHACVAVGGAPRRLRHATGDDRHLMPSAGEVESLPVDVLGDPAQLRVVVVRQDADAQGRRQSKPAS